MRSVTRTHLPMLAFITACLLPWLFPLPAHAGEGGYRLLELGGYKVKWGDRRLGVGASVSYAFAGEALRFDDARNCRDLAPIEALLGEKLSMETLARETAAAFRVWERAAALSFHEVGDARNADIVIGAQGRPRGWAFANVTYAPDPEEGVRVSYPADPEGGVRAIERALVCLNPDREWKVGFDGNMDVYDIRYTLIHEIGHAIGLDHPGPSGQVMGFRYTEAFADLQVGDLRGVQRLYGRATDGAGPAHGIDTHLAEKPTEAYRANHLVGHSAMSSTTGDETTGSISDRITDQDGSTVPVIDLLGLGDK